MIRDSDRNGLPRHPSPADLAEPSRVLWTRDQINFLAFQTTVPLAVLGSLLVARFDYGSILFTTSLGLKMVIASTGFLVIGLAAELGLCAALNCWFPPWDARYARLRKGLSALVGGLLFVLLYLPVIAVILTGPAALVIVENLNRMP